MRSPLQSFFINLLSVALFIILAGLAFLITDRLVLQGRYTSPYNKDEVIKSLGSRLNTQIQETNQLKEKLQDATARSDSIQERLNSVPSYQLAKALEQVISPNCGVLFDKGRLMFSEQTFFKVRSANLTPSAKRSLDKIAEKLLRISSKTKFPWILRIEGHADPQTAPDKFGYGSNWMISCKRAYAVCQYLIEKGMDARRFYVSGFSSYNKGPYSNNRRVSLSFDYT